MKNTQSNPNSIPPLRLLAWETTRRCNLACLHCRATAGSGPYPGELSTEEGIALLDTLTTLGQVVVILTGGEPLLREDIFELAAYGAARGHRMVMAVNGTLLTASIAGRLKEAGVQRLSISLDGATAASHDRLRAVPGAYEGALAGIAACREADLPFQINTTVTRANMGELAAIRHLAIELEAAAHHVFILVPTGRGEQMREQLLQPRGIPGDPGAAAGLAKGRAPVHQAHLRSPVLPSLAPGRRRPGREDHARRPTAWRP